MRRTRHHHACSSPHFHKKRFFGVSLEDKMKKKVLLGWPKRMPTKYHLKRVVCFRCVDKDNSGNNNYKYNNDNHVRRTIGMCFCNVHVCCITIRSSSYSNIFQQFRIAYICLKTYYARYWI